MNHVELLGRLTKDIELRYSQGESKTAICNFTLAVNRNRRKEGQPEADFIRCIAFGNNAENLSKYFRKGSRIAICGRIQTGSYERDGVVRYTTDIYVDEWEFVDTKASNESSNESSSETEGFIPMDNVPDEELPFA